MKPFIVWLARWLLSLVREEPPSLDYPVLYAAVVSREKLADCSTSLVRIRARVIEEDQKGNQVCLVTYTPSKAEKVVYSAVNRWAD